MIYSLLRNVFFSLDPEMAHDLGMSGVDFLNRAGIVDALAALGFGFIEIGTVTPRPQPGNPKPRMFRIVQKQAIINRLGFNNDGVDQLLSNISDAQFPQRGGILGINIGKPAMSPSIFPARTPKICAICRTTRRSMRCSAA